MFFDLVLLHRQHGSRFAFAWTAATRGIKYVHKNDILKTDIVKLCDDIAKYVCSQSDSPRARFSLRLSTILVNGTVRIWRQQVIYTIEELVTFLSKVRAPIQTESPLQLDNGDMRSDMFLTPPTPVPRAKGKKRPPVQRETPQMELEAIEAQISRVYETSQRKEAAGLQARAGEITLREEQPLKQEGVPEGELGILTEEEWARFQELGVEPLRPPVEPQIAIEEIEPVPVIPPPGGTTVMVEAEVHAPRSPSEVPRRLPERRPRRRVPPPQPMEVDQEAIIRVAPEEEERPVAPREEPMEVVEEAPPVGVLREIQVGALEERARASPVPARRPRRKDKVNKMMTDVRPVRNVRIDRYSEPGTPELIPIDRCPLPQIKLVAPNLTNLMNLYVIRDLLLDAQRGRRSDLSSLRDSESLRRRSGRITPIEVSDEERTITRTIPGVLEEQVVVEEPLAFPVETMPLAVMTPTPVVSSTPVVERTREEIVAVAAEEAIFSPRKRRRLLDVESEVRREFEELEVESEVRREFEELSLEPVSVPIPVPVLTDKKGRQQAIVSKLLTSATGRFTLEELCPEPIIKLNVARTFNDLLVLCRAYYVTLIPEDDSCALAYIEKGPKMRRLS